MPVVYWYSDLPPLSEKMEGEHEVAAASQRVHFSVGDRPSLWKRCYDSLMPVAHDRIVQEIVRLGGSCAHVTHEEIQTRQDDATRELWLTGTFRFVMYTHPNV